MRELALAALVPLFAATAWADDPNINLPDLVVTATRLPSPVEEIPAGVTVIDRQTIEARGYNSLTQALSDVPGVHVSQLGGPGAQASVFVRGTQGWHVLVLRDGMPVNDASDANGAYSNFGVDTLADVERIEIVRGPMAALYGSGAIGGVINIITIRGTQPGVHWTGDLAGGYPAAIRARTTVTGTDGPVDYALAAETQSLRGYDTTPQREYVYTGVPQGYRDRLLTMNLGYTPFAGTRLSLLLRAQGAYFGFNTMGGTDADGNPLPTFDNANSNGQAVSLLGRIGATTTLFDGMLESGAFIGRLQDDRKYLEPYMATDPNQASSDSRYHSYRTDVQWNNTLHLGALGVPAVLSATDLTFGYEYTGDDINERYSSSSLSGFYGNSARAGMGDNAAYAGLKTTLLQKLTITGQVRQDWVVNQSPTTWRLGAVYDVPSLSTHLKAAYGTAFRAPSLFERFGVDTFGFVGDPSLKPERAEGWEAGFITDVKLAGRPDFASFGATYFSERVRDAITQVFTPAYTEANIGSLQAHGVEVEGTIRPVTWFDLHATYTLLDTHAPGQPPAEGTRLLRRPQNSATFDATLRPIPDLRIVTSLLVTGGAYDILIGPNGNSPFIPVYGPGQHGIITNVAVSYQVRPELELYVNGWNILNSKYEAANGFQTPGPTVLAGARVRL